MSYVMLCYVEEKQLLYKSLPIRDLINVPTLLQNIRKMIFEMCLIVRESFFTHFVFKIHAITFISNLRFVVKKCFLTSREVVSKPLLLCH